MKNSNDLIYNKELNILYGTDNLLNLHLELHQLNYNYLISLVINAPNDEQRLVMVNIILDYYFKNHETIMKKIIDDKLNELLCPSTKGRAYLSTYFEQIIIHDDTKMTSLTTHAYIRIAKLHNIPNCSRIERCIRHCVSSIWDNLNNIKIKKKVFGEHYENISINNSKFLYFVLKNLYDENEFFLSKLMAFKKKIG